jgi:hypothetical protein
MCTHSRLGLVARIIKRDNLSAPEGSKLLHIKHYRQRNHGDGTSLVPTSGQKVAALLAMKHEQDFYYQSRECELSEALSARLVSLCPRKFWIP